jgi:hypothetical protein
LSAAQGRATSGNASHNYQPADATAVKPAGMVQRMS